jgi:hypothetical protein
VRVDVRADRHSDCLLNFEREVFFAEYVNGDEQEVAYTTGQRSFHCKVYTRLHTCLFCGEDMIGGKGH